MKKAFSILFAMVLLTSGMHLTIAKHFCGGEISSKKLSFTGSIASCGMETDNNNDCSNKDIYNSNCCKNQVETYSIDTNYENAVHKIVQDTKTLVQEFDIPVSISFNSFYISYLEDKGDSPPGFELSSSVDLTRIRIFRI